MSNTALIFGYGYVAKYFANLLCKNGFEVFCTSRSSAIISNKNYHIIDFYRDVPEILKKVNYILSSVPPDINGDDPVFTRYKNAIIDNKDRIKWLGYISTSSVYGNHDGSWVTEISNLHNTSFRSLSRINAENNWMSLFKEYSIPVNVFRVAGIYGRGRNALQNIKNGKNFSIFKEGHFFSRIHIIDLVNVLFQSLTLEISGEIFNVADNLPTNNFDVEQYAAKILGISELKKIPFFDAKISDRLSDFFKNNKKVSNKKMINRLDIKLFYPDYRKGLLYECSLYL
ncbi:SDR family NAD(P)-dependent oxidoreductase [Anaplasmataceae bacterium AB001_6]|nr:SDR family NAD(P)-dependent oxidoreductase [Anaplasmataceae bacterium AB001_6]